MVSTLLLVLGLAALWLPYRAVSQLRRNVAAAKASGLPYFIAPINPISPIAQLTAPVWIPIWKFLVPRRYWEDVVDVCAPDWQYKQLHGPFARNGEAFLVATPTGLNLLTDSAEVIAQITARREAFPKPTEHYEILSMFGRNVVTTEGQVWRMHRRVTSASFNEKNSALVFRVAVEQAQGMLETWLRRGRRDGDGGGSDNDKDSAGDSSSSGSGSISSLEDDTMTLALNIIAYVGFGLRLLWPGQTLPPDTDPKMVKYASLSVPPGHTFNFKDSIAGTLKHLLVLLMTPSVVLNNLPVGIVKSAREARDDFNLYMQEFLRDKVEDVQQGGQFAGMDIMGSLVATSYQQDKQQQQQASGAGAKGKGSKNKGARDAELEDSEIIGNAFIMFLAGHETTANVIHFTLLELANNPGAQRRLQADIDTILGGASDPRAWDYDAKINDMMASMLGAAMNETLRVMPPVVEVPKKVAAAAGTSAGQGNGQTIEMDGRRITLPPDTLLLLTVVSAQRNPRYWPTRPSRITGRAHDLDDWVPERWYRASQQQQPQQQQQTTTTTTTTTTKTDDDDKKGAAVVDAEDYGGFAGPDTSASLFRPARGAYMPFSDGARSCLGRRIAQVEIIAALAVIFQRYSVENAVDEWAGDDEVAGMDRADREKLYAKATARSRKTLSEATSMITLSLHGNAHIPVRLVKRGEERFVSWIDS
ncbi:cytochrome P450 [Xylariaceae sp. FL0804]|nr:cytochrome P450 [Xylariaceae sp. FL0804]